jgi:hypothetical protein
VPKQERWVDYVVVCSALLFVIPGIWLFSKGALNLSRGYASEHWPTTQAAVMSSEAEGIGFRYDVGGQDFITPLRHFGQLQANDQAEDQLQKYRYPVGATTTVAYHPHDPWIAVAEPGFNSDALWIPGAGLAFAVPGIMFIVLWFAMSRGSNRGLAVGLGMFGGIFCTLGFLFLTHGLLSLWRSYQSPHWPQAKGIVVCGCLSHNSGAPQIPEGDPQFTDSSATHFVYRFEVAGRKYFSNIRRFGQTDDRAMQNDELYPLGREITVTYAPGNPMVSTVETGISNENYWIPGAGAAFFLFGLAALVFGIPALTR